MASERRGLPWYSGRSLGILLLSLAAVAIVGAIGSRATLPAISGWYAGLSKPSWTPPNWVFGPAWTLLYILMAVAAWLVWRTRARLQQVGQSAPLGGALVPYAVQLALNLLWSLLFFGGQLVLAAMIDITGLLVAILVTITAFARRSRLAAWLLAPYFAWVCYAASLNLGILLLNP